MASPKEKKPVTLLHRLTVDAQRLLTPHQGGNEHQKRALRQVEVGNQRVRRMEGIAGMMKMPVSPL